MAAEALEPVQVGREDKVRGLPIRMAVEPEVVANHRLGAGDARDPVVSPLFGELAGLPPLLVHVGDVVLCGPFHGRVRALINEEGKRQKEAGPSVAVKLLVLTARLDATTAPLGWRSFVAAYLYSGAVHGVFLLSMFAGEALLASLVAFHYVVDTRIWRFRQQPALAGYLGLARPSS